MNIKRSNLVANAAPVPHFSRLALNLLPQGCRLETLEDKEYTVVPMVILTEGVHAGSLGPVYYPKEELAKTPAAWNHKPIVVYHPTMNGESLSACEPAILNTRKVGLMMNTRFEKGKLKSEAWIDNSRVDKVDERIMTAIKAKEMMELSTGVFIDMEDAPGEWNGEKYTAIARNYRPDHLALLPDQIGACSIADGAGLLRNAQAPVNNEMSFENIRSTLGDALSKKLKVNTINGPFPWVENVYSDFFVYSYDGKLWRQGYSVSEEGVSLSDEAPTEVRRVTEYRTVTGAYVGNQVMNKKRLVAMLLANAVTAIAGTALAQNMTDEQLNTLRDEDLEAALNGLIKKPVAQPPPAAPAPSPAPPVSNTAAPTAEPKPAPAPPKPATLQEYIAAAPKEVADVLQNSLVLFNEEKEKLIANILANPHNRFVKEDLAGRPLGELRNLSALAAPTATNTPAAGTAHYAGQAPTAATNAQAEEVLPLPVLNFTKK